MKNLRKEFPVLSQHTYLNTASSGLLYDSLLTFRQEHDLDFLIGGSLFRNDQMQFLNGVRKTIATCFGATPDSTVLAPNFSIGFNTLLHGFDTAKKVLLLNEDYPSINFAVISKGFEVCFAKIDAVLEQNIEQAIAQHQPDIFAFSLVQYTNGISIDPDFIKKLKTENPDMLIIADGTQFCGTKKFDFNTSGIDILGASGYKWLLGGYGNGFILYKNDILDQTTPATYKNASKTSDYDTSYTSLQARFESGHLDTYNFGSLQFSLDFLTNIGMHTIDEKLQKLGTYAKNKLGNRNLLEAAVSNRKNHSAIFNLKGDERLFRHLSQQHIITSLRGAGIRISLHFYNTIEDIDRLIMALDDFG